jgi:hypothetical protein
MSVRRCLLLSLIKSFADNLAHRSRCISLRSELCTPALSAPFADATDALHFPFMLIASVAAFAGRHTSIVLMLPTPKLVAAADIGFKDRFTVFSVLINWISSKPTLNVDDRFLFAAVDIAQLVFFLHTLIITN